MHDADPVLPDVLLSEFTLDQARAAGVGVRQLARLRQAGLALRTDGGLRLVDPIVPSALALAAVGPPASLCATSAARCYGWLEDDAAAPVHVVVPPERCPNAWPGTVLHRWSVATKIDLVSLNGLRLTGPGRTAVDVAATCPLEESLPMLDTLLRTRVLQRGQLLDALGRRVDRSGQLRAQVAVTLADECRASPPESLFRAAIHRAGLPPPVEQHPVRRDGVLLGRADFAWPEARVLVEIDGYEFHSAYDAFLKDRRRQNDLTLAGWTVLRFAAVDVTERPEEVVAQVRAALAAAAGRA